MLEPKEVTVNGRKYTVNPMNAMQVLEFVHGYREAKEKGTGLFAFGKRAIAQCLDESLRPLSNEQNFAECFNAHPEDMFPLEGEALDALTSPFMKPPAPTAKNATASLKK